VKKFAVANLTRRLDWLEKQLGSRSYLMGEQFTVADAYLFTVLNWTIPMKIDLKQWPNVAAYVDRVRKRPKVKEAMQEEGLLPKEAQAAR
jgi:glutathione S-transferase